MYGVPGKRLSAPVCQTGMPGRIWPSTLAHFTRRALTPTSLLVMPPFATTKAGEAVSLPTQLWSASLMATLRTRAASGVSSGRVSTTRFVETQQVMPFRICSEQWATMAAASFSSSPGTSTLSLSISINSMPGTFFNSSSWAVVFLVWLPTTMMPPALLCRATIWPRVSRGWLEMFPMALTRAAALRMVKCRPFAIAR